MHSHHTINENVTRVALLIQAKTISAADAERLSTNEIDKLQRLTPLILAGKISESRVRSKSMEDIEKLERVTPLIMTGRLSEFGACKMSLMEIEDKLFTHGHPGTFFEVSRPHTHLHTSAAIKLKI
jgi:hypothetical protein